jgi:hypothetical protein
VNTTSDPQLNGLIRTAREIAELWLGRALITSQWKLVLDCFPSYPAMRSSSRGRTSLASSRCTTEIFRAHSKCSIPRSTPSTQTRCPVASCGTSRASGRRQCRSERVWINFTAGYGATRDKVPQAIKQGMLLLIGEMYENPESLNVGNIVSEMPTLKRLWGLHQFKEMH